MSDSDESWTPPAILVAVDLVILTLRQADFHVLLIERGTEPFVGIERDTTSSVNVD